MNRYENSIRNYHNGVSKDFKNANGAPSRKAQPLDNSDRTLTIKLNPIVSTVVGKARIFGANQGTDETYNTANNMIVVIPESSHTIVKNSTFGSPFRIKGLIYETSSLSQLANPFVVVNKSVAGAQNSKTWQPSNFTDPRNFNPLMIKTAAFQDIIDATKAIEIDFVIGAYATMILTINDVLDLSQALSGRTPLKAANSY